MWNISQVKQKGKMAFKRNYWKTVFISLLMILIAGGISSGGASGRGDDFSGQAVTEFDNDGGSFSYEYNNGDGDDIFGEWNIEKSAGQIAIVVILIVVVVLIAVAIFVAVAFAIGAFLVNPLQVGATRFFVKNLNDTAQVKEIGFAFDNHYMNIVKTMFFRDLYTFLWTLLFIIPGVIKAYEYRMIPYLLAEHPDMPMEVAFAESKRLMSGNKWHAFLLDLSFIGWGLVSIITFGIAGIFYVSPYKNMTDASLYETLCYTKNNAYYNPLPQQSGMVE